MLNSIIRFSLQHRLAILATAIALTIAGLWVTKDIPVDVFPDLNRPTVTVLTEAHGLAPEEVETLVTLPIETVLNGAPGVIRLRSSSGIGISIIYVEFEWGSDIYRNRQMVAERLQLVQDRLPEGMAPIMGPITSIMGEIQFVALTSPDGIVSAMELRTLADWTIRPRLMSIPGISQVIVMGGDLKQYQILVSSEKLQQRQISLGDLRKALSEMSENTTGGFVDLDDKEFLIRPLGRLETIEDIKKAPIGLHLGLPVLVEDVAEVRVGPRIKRGEASVNGIPSVVMTILKGPHANTLELDKEIDRMIAEIKPSLPAGIVIEDDLFKQAHFIEASIDSVAAALRDGAIFVAIILFIFLANIRTTAITLVTIPLSLLITAIVFKFLGLGINTMTLGGLAIAIGELVDDAIVDVENVFRRLKENRAKGNPKGYLRVVYEASSEVRNSIIYSTLTVILVFLPLFFLGGIEGRLFKPLGIAYIVSLTASLVVSLTLTPVLCSYLLPRAKQIMTDVESVVAQRLKAAHRKLLNITIDHPKNILIGCSVLLLVSMSLIPFMGRNFLPPFNEATATIGTAAGPGISLAASDETGATIEKLLLDIPEVKSTIRRTGRAEMDEHAAGVHWSEIDVDFNEDGRPRRFVLNEIREKIEALGKVSVNIGQPISHRLDHLLSGVRTQVAVKIFGSDLIELRRIANKAEGILKEIPGVVDLSVEPLVMVPQLKIKLYGEDAGIFAAGTGTLAKELEIALNGLEVSEILEDQKKFDVFVRFDDASRANEESIGSIAVRTLPNGRTVFVDDVAQVYRGTGPNMVNRENMQRRIVVSLNVYERDLASVVSDIKKELSSKLDIPSGYYWTLGGQFESQVTASRMLLLFGSLALVVIIIMLYVHFRSFVLTLQIMLNVPLALIGSVLAIFLTERELSVATLIAFITLCGIASRNGILMISHYLHLMKEEGMSFTKDMVIRGSLERLLPVLMTAATAALALIPFALAKGEPGKELLYPVAVVIIGGLISSTLLDLIVTPAVFFRFGKKGAQNYLAASKRDGEDQGDWK